MKAVFHIFGFKADAQLRDQLASDLEDFNKLIPIAHADIALARQPEVTPPYRVVVVLSVPGPDIQAAARDHSWPAAWLKVMNRLREQITQRRIGQQARAKSRRVFHTKTGRAHGLAGA